MTPPPDTPPPFPSSPLPRPPAADPSRPPSSPPLSAVPPRPARLSRPARPPFPPPPRPSSRTTSPSASPPPSEPPPPPRPVPDAVLVALANAAAPGAGYLVLGRRISARVAAVGTLVLLVLLYAVAARWCEILLLCWWAAGIGHGAVAGRAAFAAHAARTPVRGHGRSPRIAWGRPHLLAGAAALAVLLLAGLLRFDGHRVAREVDTAHQVGDCSRVVDAQAGLWPGTRLAAAPRTARADERVDACDRLRAAAGTLRAGLAGDTQALDRGFLALAAVLPGNERTTTATLDALLRQVPAQEPCHAATVTTWLRERRPSGDALDRAASAADRAAPAALQECGDALMASGAWVKARTRYRELLQHHPGSPRAAAARTGVTRATHAIELDLVRTRLDARSGTGGLPAYCAKPTRYGLAAPYEKGDNRALVHGDSEHTDRLPADWRITDPTEATTVVCVGEGRRGDRVRTCRYRNSRDPSSPHQVTFRKIEVPVEVYELRTGARVVDRSVQIDGGSCPETVRYPTGDTDLGPPAQMLVKPSEADVRDAFRPVLKP